MIEICDDDEVAGACFLVTETVVVLLLPEPVLDDVVCCPLICLPF